MSINGISNPLLTSLGAIVRPDTLRPTADRANAATNPAANVRSALKTQTPIAGQAAMQHAVPADAPPGTDPALWSVLTSDERQFFAKTASLGPLTYGRLKAASHPTPPAARGVRLDIRV